MQHRTRFCRKQQHSRYLLPTHKTLPQLLCPFLYPNTRNLTARHPECTLFPEVWKQIQPKIKNLPLVAHNSTFDEGCLRAVLAYYQLPQHTNPFFCTLKAARKNLPQLINHKLDTVSAYFGFNLKQHHHALADAEACAHIALELFK